MLTDMQRKEILQLVKKYKFAKTYLANHYKSRRARLACEKAGKTADMYMRMLIDETQVNDKITSEDIKYFALIIDLFEPMRRRGIFKQLQPYADFDINAYVDDYNNGSIKDISVSMNKEILELSAKKMDKLRTEYKDICDNIDRSERLSKNTKRADKYRSEAYSYARAIVEGYVDISCENLQSAYLYLNTLCYPCIEGDVADRAKALLNKRLEQYKKDKPENIVENKVVEQDSLKTQEEPLVNTEFQNRVDELIQFLTEKDAMRRKEREEKIAKREQVKQERKEFIKSQKEKCENLVKNVSGKVSGLFSAVKSKIKEKQKPEIVEEVVAEPVVEHVVSESPNENNDKNNRRDFWRVFGVRAGVGVVLVAAITFAVCNFDNKKANEPVKQPQKKEVKVEPVAEKQVQNVVTVDTAYANALTNYYNSALDIIGGAKKDDVLNKINNQVKAGNIVLGDDYISAERIAYAYFIYREYGFKIDILDLAVNGNQKLTDAQQAELVKVIMDAGERGIGVQKMAKQRVESRGGTLGQHSKFEHATKAQQRQYLVNRGVLKKAHVR